MGKKRKGFDEDKLYEGVPIKIKGENVDGVVLDGNYVVTSNSGDSIGISGINKEGKRIEILVDLDDYPHLKIKRKKDSWLKDDE